MKLGYAIAGGKNPGTFMKEPEKRSERRRVPRIPVEFPVTLLQGRKHHKVKAIECSEFGILLTPALKELVGENVQVALSLEQKKSSSLSIPGVVAYASEIGIGIRFKNVPAEQQAILKEYVRAHGIGIVRS